MDARKIIRFLTLNTVPQTKAHLMSVIFIVKGRHRTCFKTSEYTLLRIIIYVFYKGFPQKGSVN